MLRSWGVGVARLAADAEQTFLGYDPPSLAAYPCTLRGSNTSEGPIFLGYDTPIIPTARSCTSRLKVQYFGGQHFLGTVDGPLLPSCSHPCPLRGFNTSYGPTFLGTNISRVRFPRQHIMSNTFSSVPLGPNSTFRVQPWIFNF